MAKVLIRWEGAPDMATNETIEKVKDGAMLVIKYIFLTIVGYIYWFGFLMLISLFLLNVWHVKIEEIFKISLALTIISVVLYGASKLLKWKKKKSR